METKDTLNRSKEGREWGACLSVVGEGVGAWGWVSIVSLSTYFSHGTGAERVGTGTRSLRGRDEECLPVLGRQGHQAVQRDVSLDVILRVEQQGLII